MGPQPDQLTCQYGLPTERAGHKISEMKTGRFAMTNRYWFAPKQYGFGYSPASWEGWLATALFIGLLVGSNHLLRSLMGSSPPATQTVVTALTLVVEIILFLWLAASRTKGSLRWRWGGHQPH
jgi:hypothetical protein